MRISRRVINTECANAHTGQTGFTTEIAACIPALDDSSIGQTCALCKATVQQRMAMMIGKLIRDFVVPPLENITVWFSEMP